MITVHGFMNVYRSGHFHRVGKPGQFDRHAGDLYPTYESAVKAIDPPHMHVDTIPVSWHEPERPPVNPDTSEPIPLHQTRRKKQSLLKLFKELDTIFDSLGVDNTHNHKCPSCSTLWSHKDSVSWDTSHENFEKHHTCPHCGTNKVYDKHYGAQHV